MTKKDEKKLSLVEKRNRAAKVDCMMEQVLSTAHWVKSMCVIDQDIVADDEFMNCIAPFLADLGVLNAKITELSAKKG